MDPQVTLDQAERHIRTGAKTANESRSQEAFREAGDKLEDYWEWRKRGGFEPKGGDARARRLGEKLSTAWETRESEDARDRAVHEDYYANPRAETLEQARRLAQEREGEQVIFEGYDGRTDEEYYAVVDADSSKTRKRLKDHPNDFVERVGNAAAEELYEEQIGDWYLVVYPWGAAHRFELVNNKTGKELTGSEPGARSNAVAAARRIIIRHESKYTNPSARKLKTKLLR